MKIISPKQIKYLKDYIVDCEKSLAHDRLTLMGNQSEKAKQDVMFSEGAYIVCKHICKLLGIKYSFCIND